MDQLLRTLDSLKTETGTDSSRPNEKIDWFANVLAYHVAHRDAWGPRLRQAFRAVCKKRKMSDPFPGTDLELTNLPLEQQSAVKSFVEGKRATDFQDPAFDLLDGTDDGYRRFIRTIWRREMSFLMESLIHLPAAGLDHTKVIYRFSAEFDDEPRFRLACDAAMLKKRAASVKERQNLTWSADFQELSGGEQTAIRHWLSLADAPGEDPMPNDYAQPAEPEPSMGSYFQSPSNMSSEKK